MGTLEAIGLAVLQGLTEFLPVSSSGHLALGHWLFEAGNGEVAELPLAFVVMVHFGTLLAVVAYYRSDLLRILRDIFAPQSEPGRRPGWWGRRLALLLIIATIPGAVGGYLFAESIDTLINTPWAVGIALMITATALLVSERVAAHDKRDEDTGLGDAIVVGLAQMVALVPGISRSGSCIAAGLVRGFSQDWAPRFAFLLSVPVILGGTLFTLKDMVGGEGGSSLPLYGICALVSAVTGYLAIVWVIGWVRAGNLKYFAIYCYAIGLAAIIVSAGGLL